MSEKTTPEPQAPGHQDTAVPAETRVPGGTSPEAMASDVVLDTAGGQMPPSAVPAATQRRGRDRDGNGGSVLHQIFTGSAMVSVLSVLLAIVLGGILMAVTNPKVAAAAGYFFAQPGDLLTEVIRPYTALVQGSIFNWAGADLGAQLYPITETLTVATPPDLRRAWRCPGVPCRPVQHRRSGSDHLRRALRRLRRLCLAPADRTAPAGCHRGWPGRRRGLGRRRRPAEGSHRGA